MDGGIMDERIIDLLREIRDKLDEIIDLLSYGDEPEYVIDEEHTDWAGHGD